MAEYSTFNKDSSKGTQHMCASASPGLTVPMNILLAGVVPSCTTVLTWLAASLCLLGSP